jgi:hypothetical protein
VKAIHHRVLELKIITGDASRNTVLLPRLAIDHEADDLPFKLRRLQFPINLAFSMTINKAQGQSLDVVGAALDPPVFSHGQLYVALSRATKADKAFVLLPPGADRQTPNVVRYSWIRIVICSSTF